VILYLLLSILITLAYVIVIVFTIKGWKAIPIWSIPDNAQFDIPISILIPARNEEENIGRLLDQIIQQSYPRKLVQIIVIDDHSEDDTANIVKNYASNNVKLINLANHIDISIVQSFKKAAIETAIKFATGKLIVQTDADCEMGEEWLSSVVSYFQAHDVKMVTAPVNFHREKNLLEKFQSLDFIGMMGVTGAGIHYKFMRMCNGANLCYEKKVFEEVEGFKGNEDKASGDDMFLLHKVADKYPNQIGFIKAQSATVFTAAKPTLQSFYQQRLRWATKNADYDDLRVLMVNAIVFFTCFFFFTAIIFFITDPFYFGMSILFILFGKGIADFFFLRMMSSFFGRKDLMKTFLSSQLMHNAYIFTIGMAANFVKKYEWKGRKVQ
jgi:cellulose synthase/poly-beta-1,6-N-acetylglucosamine synthase-like glycosyltransferase